MGSISGLMRGRKYRLAALLQKLSCEVAAPKLRIKNLSTAAYHRFGSNQSTAMNKAAVTELMIRT
jgi:hypothetical protein